MLVFLVTLLAVIAVIDLVCFYTVKFQLEKLKHERMGPGMLPERLPVTPSDAPTPPEARIVHITISGKNRLTSAKARVFQLNDTVGMFMRLMYDKELHQYDLISIDGVDTSPRDAENTLLIPGMNIKFFESIG